MKHFATISNAVGTILFAAVVLIGSLSMAHLLVDGSYPQAWFHLTRTLISKEKFKVRQITKKQ